MSEVNISPEQIQRAAMAGANLLADDERVSVPPSMALSGDLSVLNAVLLALANGQAVISSPEQQMAQQVPPTPETGAAEADNDEE